MATPVIISDVDFINIMTEVGYPVITLADLIPTGVTMTEDDVKTNLIFPAMREFFMFFPKQVTDEYGSSSQFSVPFPDDQTFGVLDARVILKAYGASGVTASPFMNDLYIRRSDSGVMGKYGTRQDYDFFELSQLRRIEMQGSYESYKAVKVKTDLSARVVTGYSAINGKLNITWAKWSYDFNEIPFNFNWDVVQLARSNVLHFFGALRQQAAAALPTDVSGDTFVERAKELRAEVLERWRSLSKVVIIRG